MDTFNIDVTRVSRNNEPSGIKQGAPEKISVPPEKQEPLEKEQVDLSREAEDIASVSVSEDGDVVAVSDKGVKALNEDGNGNAIREDSTDIEITDDAKETVNTAAKEEEDVSDKAMKAVEEQNARAEEVREILESQLEEKAEDSEEMVANAVTARQVEQMFMEGKISEYEYEQKTEAISDKIQAEKEDFTAETNKMAGLNNVARNNELGAIEAENVTKETEEAVDAMQRIRGNESSAPEQGRPNVVTDNGNEAGGDQNAKDARKVEEEGRLWDYQLLA